MCPFPKLMAIILPHEPILIWELGQEMATAVWPRRAPSFSEDMVPAVYVGLPVPIGSSVISVPRRNAGRIPAYLSEEDPLLGAVTAFSPVPSPLGVMIPAGLYEAEEPATPSPDSPVRLRRLVRPLPLSAGPRWCVFPLPTRARGYWKQRADIPLARQELEMEDEEALRGLLRRIYRFHHLFANEDEKGTTWRMLWGSPESPVETVFRVIKDRGRIRLVVEHPGFCVSGPDGTMSLSPFLLGVLHDLHVPGSMLSGRILVCAVGREG